MVTALHFTPQGGSDIPHSLDLLNRQRLNKGTAFTEEERAEFGLTLDEQAVRAYEAFQRKDNDLERHIYSRALQELIVGLHAIPHEERH
jgi:malate dehydrogenase (oxaloacetate-decarboxylating)